MFQILSHGSNCGCMYTVRSVIFNLDHEIDSLHFILNGKDPIPSEYKWASGL
jgi:hypothetical protein